jgi:hypothetical protein
VAAGVRGRIIPMRKGELDHRGLWNILNDQSIALALFLYSPSNLLISLYSSFSEYRLSKFSVTDTMLDAVVELSGFWFNFSVGF